MLSNRGRLKIIVKVAKGYEGELVLDKRQKRSDERSYQFWHSCYVLRNGAGLLAIWRSPDGTNGNGNRLKGKLPKIESGPPNMVPP